MAMIRKARFAVASRPALRLLAASLRLLAASLLCLAVAPAPAEAQWVQGVVLDAHNRRALEGAAVVVADSTGGNVHRALTGADGHFRVPDPPPGLLTISVEAFGYGAGPSRQIEFDGQPLFLEILLDPQPVEAEGLRVSVTAQTPYLRATGFYERRRKGLGTLLAPDDLAKLQPIRSSELLRRVPSVTVLGREPVISRGGVGFNAGRQCLPDIYVDGAAVRLNPRPTPFELVVPPPEHIDAIEVYPGGASIPAQWRGSSSGCGVIVVWTKH